MLVQPAASQITYPLGMQPVQKSIWKYFSDIQAATGLLQLAKNICPNAELVDSNDLFFGGSLVYNTDRVKAWSISGTIVVGSGADSQTLTVLDSCGWLLDRVNKPDVWVDRNPDGSVGGPTLKFVDIGGYAQLYWGK